VAERAVSVVVPTFRRELTLVAAIRSALAQEGVHVEVIVLDDSPEGSARDAVAALDDARVRYVRRERPSGGVPAAVRNEGLALARGEYVHFLDDDDLLEEGALAALSNALEATPAAGVAIGTVIPFGEDVVVLAQQQAYFARAAARLRATAASRQLVSAMLFDPTPLVNSACMIRRRCAEQVGGYGLDVARAEDVDFYMRAIRRCGHVFVDRPVLRYRTGAPSLMHSMASGSALLSESYQAIHNRYRREHGVVEFVLMKLLARWQRWRGTHQQPPTRRRAAPLSISRTD
jgi:glycosyltransferase involved in cell wall biosynthesis